MRYRELVFLIVLVAVSAWALEVRSEPALPEEVSVQEDLKGVVPSLDLVVSRESEQKWRFEINLDHPGDVKWDAFWAELQLGDEILRSNGLSQLDHDSWAFELEVSSEQARSILERADDSLVSARATVLESGMKMSRSMRTFQVESSSIAWVTKN